MGDMFSSYLKASTWGNEKMSSSLNDENGKIMTNGGQISKKLQKPFHSEAFPQLCILAFPLPCPASTPTTNTKTKKKKKSESKAENESSPEVTAAPFKEREVQKQRGTRSYIDSLD